MEHYLYSSSHQHHLDYAGKNPEVQRSQLQQLSLLQGFCLKSIDLNFFVSHPGPFFPDTSESL